MYFTPEMAAESTGSFDLPLEQKVVWDIGGRGIWEDWEWLMWDEGVSGGKEGPV